MTSMVTLVGGGWAGVACSWMGVAADVARVLPARRSCKTRLATDGATTPAAGKNVGATYKLQLAVPLMLDSSVALHDGKSTCSVMH